MASEKLTVVFNNNNNKWLKIFVYINNKIYKNIYSSTTQMIERPRLAIVFAHS